MRKSILVVMALMMCVMLTACSQNETPQEATQQPQVAATSTDVKDAQMRELFGQMVAEKGEIYTWSPEDKAEYAGKLADIGYVRTPVRGTPTGEDMTEADAIKQAKTLVSEFYGIDMGKLDTFTVETFFVASNPSRPEWELNLRPPAGEASLEGYMVIIESRTGQVMDLSAESEGNG